MTLLEFANKLESTSSDAGLEGMARRLLEATGRSVVYLIDYLDSVPVELHDDYRKVLRDVLQNFPASAVIEVPRGLRSALTEFAGTDTDLASLIEERILSS